MTLAFIGIGTGQILLLLVVILLLFGKRLPETMRNLGKSMTEFKRGVKEGGEEDEEPNRVEQE